MTASEGGSGVSRTEGWALAALVAAAAGLRWIVWTRTVVLFDDGPRFLAIARAMDAGWWSAALLDAFHPFYPLLVVAVRRGLGLPDSAGGWESAGALVSVAGGAAAVGFLFLFLRDAFGRGPAWCGAILLAVHGRATDYSSDVQSDGLYLGLFAAGLWLGWRAWRRRAVAPAAGAGLAAGLAYLTRPEGLGLLPVFAGLAGLEIVRRRWPLAAGARWLAALGAGALVCIAPYIVALHEVSGEWALTRKKSLGAMVRAEPAETPGAPAGTGGAQQATTGPGGAADPAPPLPPWTVSLGSTTPAGIDPRSLSAGHREQDGLRVALAPSAGSRAWEAFRMLVRHSRSALGYGALGLLIAGLVAARGAPGPRAMLLALLVGLYGLVLYALTVSSGYVSRRHALPPLVPLFGYAGLGALFLGAVLARAGQRPRWVPAAGVGILLLVGVGELARSWEPKRDDERAERAAAEWLRDHAPEPGLLAASRQRFGYYAGMPYVSLSGIADDALGRYLSEAGARYVLLDDREPLEALLRTEGSEVRLLHHLEVSGAEAWLLERAAFPGAGR